MHKNLLIISLISILFCSKVQGAGSEIVVSAQSGVYCLNGSDGSLRWSFPHPSIADSLHVWEQSGPAIGNMDSAANAEVVFGADKLYCLDLDNGSLKWSYTPGRGAFWLCSPAMVNIDTVGNAEILATTVILDSIANIVEITGYDLYCINSDGSLKWSRALAGTSNYPWTAPAVTAEDIDNDGLPEAIATTSQNVYCFSSTGSVKWSSFLTAANFETGIAIADIDLNGTPDIIITASNYGSSYQPYIYGFTGSGSEEWVENIEMGLPSNAAIADINKDGKVEIVIHFSEHTNMPKPATGSNMEAFQKIAGHGYLDELWSTTTQDYTCVSTSCPVLCDLEGSGNKDVLWVGTAGFPGHNGELQTLKGTNGALIDTSGCFSSETINEHSISVADIDGSGYVSIVGIDTTFYGVSAVSSTSWGEARNLWTSHLYHITDINNDVTVPRREPQSWKSHNTWLNQNITGGSGTYVKPTLKWDVRHPEFGNIYASIAIAPLTAPSGVNESQGVNKLNNPQIAYEGNRIALMFNLGKTEALSYKLFDIAGRPAGKQVSEVLAKGQHKIWLNSEEFRNGIYFIQVNLGTETLTRKIVLVK